MLADLNDRLNDATNAQLPEADKIRYLNHGIRATWPKIYKTARDATLVLVADTYEYALPAAVGNNTRLLRVEIESGVSSGRYSQIFDFEIAPGLTDPILVLGGGSLPGPVGAKVRITAAKHLIEFAVGADVYDGPSGTEELPVLYAMGIITGRRLDDRVDHRRFSTTTAVNGVSTDDIMTVSQFNFAQFELLLDRFAMPLPAPQG